MITLTMRRRGLTLVTILYLSLFVSLFTILYPQQAQALSGSDFNAGRIIDDSLFFNGDTMTETQIQTFLDAKMPSCDTDGSKSISYYFRSDPIRIGDDRDTWVTTTRAVYGDRYQQYWNSLPADQKNPVSPDSNAPFTCLKDYGDISVPSKAPEDSLCNGVTAASNRTAAQVIDIVAASCGISEKALLVLLQKEQGLISDDWPWGRQYTVATGYGCPDSGPNNSANCDSQYYGFFNQVYLAARVFKYYAKYPGSFNHLPRQTNYILYNPNTSCGGSNIYIENQATAGLYNYTPYQPNAAALDNLYGNGDGCSAYGNRNFWRMYNDWFGSTEGTPFFRVSGSSKIYILGASNNYYYVSTPSLLLAYGYGVTVDKIATVSANYIEGRSLAGKLPLTARFEDNPVYIMDKGKRHHLKSPSMVERYGFNLGEEAQLPLSTESYYPKSTNVRYVIRDTGNSKLFWMEDGKRRYIDGPSAYRSGDPAYEDFAIIALSGDFLSSRIAGPRILAPSTLYRINSGAKIFWVNSSDSSVYVPSPSIMIEFSLKFEHVRNITTLDSSGYPEADRLGRPLVKDVDNTVYLISPTGKRLVTAEMLSPDFYNIDSGTLVSLDKNILNSYVAIEALSDLIQTKDDSRVYKVENGEKRHISGPSVLYSLGYTNEDISIVSESFLNSLPTGATIY